MPMPGALPNYLKVWWVSASPFAFLFAARILWEKTIWTWSRGPQIVGLASWHIHPGFAQQEGQRDQRAHALDLLQQIYLRIDAGRSASLPEEPRRGLLSGTTTRAQELGRERAAVAYQQRGRSVSAHAAGAGSAAYLGTIRHRLRSQALGTEAGGAWWE